MNMTIVTVYLGFAQSGIFLSFPALKALLYVKGKKTQTANNL